MILPLEFRQGRETEKDEVGNPESTALISVQVQGIGLLFGKLSISYMWYKLYMFVEKGQFSMNHSLDLYLGLLKMTTTL